MRSSHLGLLSSLVALSVGALAACGGSQPGASSPSGSTVAAVSPDTPKDAPLTEAPKPPKATGNPFTGMKLWIDPESLSMLKANSLRKLQPWDPLGSGRIAISASRRS